MVSAGDGSADTTWTWAMTAAWSVRSPSATITYEVAPAGATEAAAARPHASACASSVRRDRRWDRRWYRRWYRKVLGFGVIPVIPSEEANGGVACQRSTM